MRSSSSRFYVGLAVALPALVFAGQAEGGGKRCRSRCAPTSHCGPCGRPFEIRLVDRIIPCDECDIPSHVGQSDDFIIPNVTISYTPQTAKLSIKNLGNLNSEVATVEGTATYDSSAHTLTVHGPAVLTGGAFGPGLTDITVTSVVDNGNNSQPPVGGHLVRCVGP